MCIWDTYSNVSTSAAWRNAWWSQWSMNINGASSSCIPCNTARTQSQVSLIQQSKTHQYTEKISSLWNFCKGNILSQWIHSFTDYRLWQIENLVSFETFFFSMNWLKIKLYTFIQGFLNIFIAMQRFFFLSALIPCKCAINKTGFIYII